MMAILTMAIRTALSSPSSLSSSVLVVVLLQITLATLTSSYTMKTTINKNILLSRCQCGSTSISLPHTTLALVEDASASSNPSSSSSSVVVDCHCRSCRRYHVAAFSSFLIAPKEQVIVTGETKTFRDNCFEIGIVDRVYCPTCFTKMATTPLTATDGGGVSGGESSRRLFGKILINMGPLEDSTIPRTFGDLWKMSRTSWQKDGQASWTNAMPEADKNNLPRSGTPLRGGCACGTSRYQINYKPATEIQHCYCRLCRKLSGSAFMTWLPVSNQNLEWDGEPPPLVRTTNHGQRHICQSCGGVITIVYDGQPDCIWPAAGSLDDTSLPTDTVTMSQHLYRICHICCRYLPNWYALPQDGLERIREAC